MIAAVLLLFKRDDLDEWLANHGREPGKSRDMGPAYRASHAVPPQSVPPTRATVGRPHVSARQQQSVTVRHRTSNACPRNL